jgi:ligand-binding sensor domain-containing protein
VGTAQGLSSYDGYRWKKYDQEVTDGVLGKNPVGGMAFDKKRHGLWIFSLPSTQSAYSDSNNAMSDPNAALIQYDISNNNWIAYTRANTSSQDGGGLPSDKIQSLGVDSNGDVWVSTFVYSGTGEDVKIEYKGLSRFNVDQHKWTHYTTASNNDDNVLKTNCINKISGDDPGSLWFGGVSTSKDDTEGIEGGLYLFDIETNKWTDHFYKGKSGVQLGSNVITALAVDGSALWVGTVSTDGTSGGVSFYDGNSWKLFTTADGLVDNTVTAIAVQDNGDVWFGTPKGLSRYGSGPGNVDEPSFDPNRAFYFPSKTGCFTNSLDNSQNSLFRVPWFGWIFLVIGLLGLFSILRRYLWVRR